MEDINISQLIKLSGKYDLDEITFAFEKWAKEQKLSFWNV